MGDRVVPVTTYIHLTDIRYVDSSDGFHDMVYVSGEDRCGWHFCGYIDRERVAEVLFP